jgi:protein TonB
MTYAERAPSRQISGAAAVVAIHAALILALASGLANRQEILLPPPIELVPVDSDEPMPQEPAEKPDVVNPDWIPDLSPPTVEFESEPDKNIIVAQPADHTFSNSVEAGSALALPSPLRSDPRHPLTPPDYPASEIRRNHEGTVQLLIYVLPNGRVGEVKVGRSSGYPLLDDAAVRKARSAWRFLPAKSGSGQAIAAWGTFDVRFELR